MLDRPGVWLISAAGVLTGMDLPQALASLPSGLDVDRARSLLIAAEAAYLIAHWKKRKETSDG